MAKSLVTVPMSKGDLQKWQSEVERAQRRTETLAESWKQNVEAFASLKQESNPDVVWVNKDWPRTKQKIAQLFFRVPELIGKPKQPRYTSVVPIYTSALNDMLNRRMRVAPMVDEVLTDVATASGVGVSVLGYEQLVKTVSAPMAVETPGDPASAVQPVPEASQLDQETQDALRAEDLMRTETVDVPIHQRYFWERISPANFLWPASFRGSDWDKAPWLGYRFELPLVVAKRKYKLPASFKATAKPMHDKLLSSDLDDGVDGSQTNEETVQGVEIWYYAHIFDAKESHPHKVRRLVLLDGLEDRPAIHEDSPYQVFDPLTYRYVGQCKLPIRVLTLTYVPDRATAPSDSQVSRPQVRELVMSRTLQMLQRKRSLPIRWFDVNQVDEEASDILRSGDIQSWIPMNGPGERAIGEIARATYPRESFEFDRVIESDLNEIWSMGPAQVGADTVGRTTAREVSAMENAVQTRLDYERSKVLRWFVDGAEMVGQLMQVFHTDQEWVEVVGEDGLKRLEPWDRTKIQGDIIFEVKPDSAQRVDVSKEREDSRNLYSFLAKDPHVNSSKLLETVLLNHGLDPGTVITQPPPKKPESPAIAYRFGGQDMSPIMPDGQLNLAFPLVISILQQAGVQIDPKLVAALMQKAQQQSAMAAVLGPMPGQETESPREMEHGGLAPQTSSLSKHHAEGKGVQ